MVDFTPGLGLIEANLGVYSSNSGIRDGLSYLTLDRLQLGNERISLTGGDFSVAPDSLLSSFGNGIAPTLQMTGFRVHTEGNRHTFRAFWGKETLLQGLGIPLMTPAGQNVGGVEGSMSFSSKFALGGRVLYLSRESPSALSSLFANIGGGPALPAALTTKVDATYIPFRFLQTIAELGYSRFQAGADTAWHPSYLGGLVFLSSRVKANASISNQASSYLPVAGYFTGARRQLVLQGAYKITHWMNVSGSMTDQKLTSIQYLGGTNYHGTSSSVGASFLFPHEFTLSGQYSNARYDSIVSSTSLINWQHASLFTVVASRAFARHAVHLSGIQLRSTGTGGPQGQTSLELQDDIRIKQITLSGASRFQQTSEGGVLHDGLYGRGGVQAALKRLSFYARFEFGSDLASRSLFTTSATTTNTFGVQYRARSGWNVSADVWRSHLALNVTPDSTAVLALNLPVLPLNSSQNQWTAMVRLSKQLHWGPAVTGADVAGYATRSTPRIGRIEGMISVVHPKTAPSLVSGVPVLLDGFRSAISDATGHYRFSNVSQGIHTIAIDERRLPVEFIVPKHEGQTTTVDGQRTTRVDFEVRATGRVEGMVIAADKQLLTGLFVKLEPGGQYTFVDPDGHFSMEGIPEGGYDLSIHGQSSDFLVVTPQHTHFELTSTQSDYLSFSAAQHLPPIRVRDVPVTNTGASPAEPAPATPPAPAKPPPPKPPPQH
jgi:hypothetical protein